MSKEHSKYQPEIDGLRALAVSCVLYYHSGLPGVTGGFVGVDIFFVISGFLITRIIQHEIENGIFSIKYFYLRRIKRILPAYFAMGFITIAVGYFILLPYDYINLASSFAHATVFISNVFFMTVRGGYFGSGTDEMALTHTWSLSVEEQYYFLLPLCLILCAKYLTKRTTIVLVIAIAFLSFIFADLLAESYSRYTYFLLPTRGGELLIGSIIALLPNLGKVTNQRFANIFSGCGLALILYSVMVLDKSSKFPGYNALIPCLGVALIIATCRHHSTVVGKILSLRPIVALGLISYSLYLVHWPIISYVTYLGIEKTNTISITIIVASIVLAYLSWRFIENPLRKIDMSFRTTFISLFLIPTIASLALSFFILQVDGAPGRFSKSGWGDRTLTVSPKKCLGITENIKDYPTECMIGNKIGKADQKFALWGDSFADMYVNSMDVSEFSQDYLGYTYIMHSCPAILNMKRNEPQRIGANFSQKCSQYNENVFNVLVKSNSINTVIISSSYPERVNLIWTVWLAVNVYLPDNQLQLVLES